MARGEPSVWDELAVSCWPRWDMDQIEAWAGPVDAEAGRAPRYWRTVAHQLRIRPVRALASLVVGATFSGAGLLLIFWLTFAPLPETLGPWRFAPSALVILLGLWALFRATKNRERDRAGRRRILRRERRRLVRGLGEYVGGDSGAELISRRQHWARRALRAQSSARAGFIALGVIAVPVAPGLLFGDGPPSGDMWLHVWHWLFRGPWALAIGLAAWSAFSSQREARFAARALEDVSCPACGYDLMPPGGLGDASRGVFVGPARCPECGDRWPLVPPPVPESKRPKTGVAH
jgi:hypothetical protein